jgi:hypothetical protein
MPREYLRMPQPLPRSDGLYGPVVWRRFRPGDGIPRREEFETKIRQQGAAYASELQRSAADEKEDPAARCCAMGYLVALQRRGELAVPALIQFFEKVARETKDPSCRQDALFALAYLETDYQVEQEAINKLITLVNDPDVDRHQVQLALAATIDQRALEPVASGVLELDDDHEYDRETLADAVRAIPIPWRDKAKIFIQLLKNSSRQRNQVTANAVLQALAPERGEVSPQHMQEIEDYLMGAACEPENQNDRMNGILAELIVACEGGDSERAGHRINAYERNHNLAQTVLHNLRVQMGGAPAITGIMGVLRQDLERYFQQPIYQLNVHTQGMWKKVLADAGIGFRARLWMSITAFAVGMLLLAISSFQILFSKGTGAMSIAPFTAGLGTMLLMIYVGPLKDIRQSVSDLATANAAFMAYVHRILETSHTFSYLYMKEKISLEETQKASAIIKEAMDSTVQVLNMKAIDSSEDVIRRALATALREQRISGRRKAPPRNVAA